jgi:uncharacterized protein (DUF2141 family)
MRTKPLTYLIIVFYALFLTNCANRGTPQGGPKDETPPEIEKSEPENFSVNFDSDEIKITFNEYVRIKDLQKHLIISPPLKTIPEITPLGTASKEINIKIYDTLIPNTTYAFNFGESIVDNNESNPYPFYRYVFSTGDYIDSLEVNGMIIDAFDKNPEEFVSVMLYEVDSTFSDSIVYRQKPKYITNTLDSTNTFQLQNLKAGKYMMIAMKDNNTNYTFEQNEDKIGFLRNYITLPTDSVYTISLFKENLDFNIQRPKLISGNKIAFGMEGDNKDVNFELLSNAPENYRYRIMNDLKSDTLYYFYMPDIKEDSLLFRVSKGDITDTLKARLWQLPKDSLSFSAFPSGTIDFLEPFKVRGNVPFVKLDKSKIRLMNRDSLAVPFTTTLDTLNNSFDFDFEKDEEEIYEFQFLPGTFVDLFEQQNDTLTYKVRTKTKESYGNIRLSLVNAKYPLIVQLTDEKGEVRDEKYFRKAQSIDFKYVNPGKYLIRVLFDSNKNEAYDTGNYLKKEYPERVSYYPDIIEVRAGWDEILEFTLLD